MSLDQCHSTVGELPVVKPRAASHTQVGVTGKAYWRSVEDLADTPEFRDWLEREFPSGASRLLDSSRRTFMKLMGASLALAGAATMPGCRRPDHKIMPYSREVPEEIIPGKPLYFATSIHLPGGSVEGVLVETHEGRPTKIEGNPLHPTNNGKSSHWAQASILGLYDPDRLKDPVFTPEGETTPRSWADFKAWSKKHFAKFAENKGEGLAFLVDKKRSPSREALRAQIIAKYPNATWVAYDPAQSDAPIEATRACFGKPMREVLHLDKADVIVSFDRDFLCDDADRVRNMRGFAAKRQVLTAASTMSRIYMVESNFSTTGAKADHRWPVAPSAIAAFAVALAREINAQKAGAIAGPLAGAVESLAIDRAIGVDAAAIREMAKDLIAAGAGKSLVLAGPTQPAPVHALCAAINAALGNIGQTVSYRDMGADEAAPLTAFASLVASMKTGTVDTIVCIGVNPAYDAPGSLDFGAAWAKVPNRLVASTDNNETVAAATWRLPLAHELESWGDSEAIDGTLAPVQPMIAPLYAAASDIEILLTVADASGTTDGYTFVRDVWQKKLADGFEKKWRRALHDGVFAGTEAKVEAPKFDGAKVGPMLAALAPRLPSTDRMDVVFAVGMPADGRFANHAWLQELPDPLTKIVWDNVALVSPATSKHFDIRQQTDTEKKRKARMITITVAGQKMSVPAWEMSGIPDNTVIVQLGYGRKVCGLVGDNVGFNAFGLSGNTDAAGNRRFATGGLIERAAEGARWHNISTTQMHGSMEGRAIVREVDLPAWKKYGDDPFAGLDDAHKSALLLDPYGQKRSLNFAERLGELAHAPANVNSYINPQRGSKEEIRPKPTDKNELGQAPDFATGQQWGMSIDLTTCTGCSACTIACQSENNIPVVGKIEVNKGRELHWIRVDRYFSGNSNNIGGSQTAEKAMFQPVACVHCENAPCEVVCPVNATVHGPEGINYMVYNRCIGTRYCANNCPYKVRRFNFFQWGTKRYQGGYIGQDSLKEIGVDGPANHNLIPPRLREELNEIQKLQQNPDVTVRSRGVMEKCSYCIQRINEARIEVKLRNMKSIPDGFFQTACQQSCPTDAIVFGDIHDPQSRITKLRNHQRSYLLLGYLNTRPRTTYLASIRNPNPALVDAATKAGWDHPFDHGHGDGHGSEGDDHHHPHAGGEGGKHALLGYDPSKSFEDRGYRMSLAVLGGAGGKA